MPNYRSKVGGYFQNPETSKEHVSVRTNNPGAVNGAGWEKTWPGYVKEIKYDGVNNTTVFETPEDGVAVWYELMRKYRKSGQSTIKDIVWKYGGGQANYNAYGHQVAKWMGVSENTEIVLESDGSLLPFAKAMFRYESGVNPIPWTDAQIIYGFNMARKITSKVIPVKKEDPPKAPTGGAGKIIVVGGIFATVTHFAGAHPQVVIGVVAVAVAAAVVAWAVARSKPPA